MSQKDGEGFPPSNGRKETINKINEFYIYIYMMVLRVMEGSRVGKGSVGVARGCHFIWDGGTKKESLPKYLT